MLQMLTTCSVYHCGVIPEADYFVRGGASIPPRNFRQDEPNLSPSAIPTTIHARLYRDELARVYAYTDGSACNPHGHRRRRAAWGVRQRGQY